MDSCENHLVSTPSCANCQAKVEEDKRGRCPCGALLSSFSRSLRCGQCREKSNIIRQLAGRTQTLETVHETGFVILHSCLGSPANREFDSCSCRKTVTLDRAREMVRDGRAVDWQERVPYFFGKGRDILVAGKLQRTPRAPLTEKAHLARAYTSDSIKPKKRTPEELRRFIEEDRRDRNLEERMRIEIVGEMQAENLRSLIREVPAEIYDAMRATQIDVPVVWTGIGEDDRTLGGVGRTVFSPQTQPAGFEEPERIEEDEENETTDFEDQEVSEVSEPATDDADAKVIPIDREFDDGEREIEEEDVEAA